MLVRASIEPLNWENTFFGVKSAIVRVDPHAPVLTADSLQPQGAGTGENSCGERPS